jgi:hypothetical protein
VLHLSCRKVVCSTLLTRDGIKEMQGKCEDRVSDSSVLSCLLLAVVCKTSIPDLERLILFLARKCREGKSDSLICAGSSPLPALFYQKIVLMALMTAFSAANP